MKQICFPEFEVSAAKKMKRTAHFPAKVKNQHRGKRGSGKWDVGRWVGGWSGRRGEWEGSKGKVGNEEIGGFFLALRGVFVGKAGGMKGWID